MKKKAIAIIIVIILIVSAIIIIKKINQSKINYEITQITNYEYFKYSENEKIGIIDREGNIVIEAKYDNIAIPNPMKDIFICYNNDVEKSTILNSKNEELFTQYEDIKPIKLKNIASILCYEKSVLEYKKDGLYGIIDFSGKEITKNIYTSIENLQSTEGKLLVCKDDKYGIININGTELVKAEYDKIETDGYYTETDEYLKSGFIVSNTTSDGYRYGYIDYNGKEILKVEYNEIIRLTDLEEVYLITSTNGKYGLYKKSKEIIKPEYQSIVDTNNKCLIIQKNKNYGVANLEGKIIVETKYESIEDKGIYLYAQTSSENDVYDIAGNKIDINFNKTIYKTENEEYRIATTLNNNITYYGIENKEGKSLVNAGYRYLEYLYKDYFIAKDDSGKIGVINSNGKVIIELKYDLVQKVKDKNIVQTLDTENYQTELYSHDLKLVTTMKDATISNEKEYIKIYNEEETKYFDSNGKEIEEQSETIPNIINEYTKVQNSLDDIYYIKK